MRRRGQRGATTIEMTLVGIPIIFILISIFEISRGMWMYNTASTAIREGVRMASVHGINCINNPPGVPNNCPRTANQIITVIRDGRDPVANLPIGAGAAGLNPTQTTVTFISKTLRFDCLLDGTTGGNCNSTWPPTAPAGENSIKTPIEIQIRTPFYSALSMFWPGSKPVSVATVNLFASSSDTIEF